MRAAVMYGAGDVRVEDRPDPQIVEPTDAVVRTVAACVCGSDLWPYRSMPATGTGRPMGHEFLGVVEETGTDVRGLTAGDLVVAPFTYSDHTCDYCARGLDISCRGGRPVRLRRRGRRAGRSRPRPVCRRHPGDAGRVFDQTFSLDETPDAYRAMADRQVLKALIAP